MMIQVLRSKIHHATITQADLQYKGSLTLDEELMDAAGLFHYEKIQVVNVNNGERIETYVIKGGRGTGVCCLNGPAARKGAVGDTVVIMSYGLIEADKAKAWQPVVVHPAKDNKLEQS